jgi:hypothetical protein
MAGGRPSKRTPELMEHIKDSLSHGLDLSETAARAGIHRETLREWLKDPDVADEVASAMADLKLSVIKSILAGGKDWFGKGWWLERRDPAWAKPELKWQMQLHDYNQSIGSKEPITEAEILKHIAVVRGLDNVNGQ